jgi:hypothetical protein
LPRRREEIELQFNRGIRIAQEKGKKCAKSITPSSSFHPLPMIRNFPRPS